MHQNAIVGTWRIVAFEDYTSAGDTLRALGDSPIGYLMYSATGHMAVQLTASPVHRDGDRVGGAVPAEYVAYFGKFTLTESGRAVVHHIEGGLQPVLDGEARPLRLVGDTLILGDARTWRRVFVRVR
jgi:hypothetical protein